MTTPQMDPDDARGIHRIFTFALLAFALAIGVSIVWGGVSRWGSPAYRTALMVPGAPESWGWIIAATAAIGLALFLYSGPRRQRALSIVMFTLGTWAFFFGVSFFIEFHRQDTVSASGFLMYWFVAFIAWMYSVLYWRGNVPDAQAGA